MLRFENYFCCLLNCYFIFCSYVLLSELNSRLTKNCLVWNQLALMVLLVIFKQSFTY